VELVPPWRSTHSVKTNYTTVLADAGKSIFHPLPTHGANLDYR
jgi:hypothetical protein